MYPAVGVPDQDVERSLASIPWRRRRADLGRQDRNDFQRLTAPRVEVHPDLCHFLALSRFSAA
jgi:hypothetical protein